MPTRKRVLYKNPIEDVGKEIIDTLPHLLDYALMEYSKLLPRGLGRLTKYTLDIIPKEVSRELAEALFSRLPYDAKIKYIKEKDRKELAKKLLKEFLEH